MNAPEKFFLPDIQSQFDERALAIQEVGVSGLRYPVAIGEGDGSRAVGDFTMTVGLPASSRGTHMSRFVEFLEQERAPWSVERLPSLLSSMLSHLGAESGGLSLAFPFFVRKSAPVSGVESYLDYDARWSVAKDGPAAEAMVDVEVRVPATSLCPCSKQISDYGAHNQRSMLTLHARLRDPVARPVSLEELIRYAEKSASCEVFGLLKRPDEKWVTEYAYDHPKFVEDLVRDIALQLKGDARIARWSVTAENFESIHNHSAYATLRGVNGD